MRILPPIALEAVEQASYGRYSRQAVRNIYEAAVAKRERLTLHQARVECWVGMAYDLYELLKLGERLQRIDGNLAKLDAKIRELKAELFKRRLRDMA